MDFTFKATLQDQESSKCRLMIPLEISKQFPADAWYIEELYVNGEEFRDKVISKNMRKYHYILFDKCELADFPKDIEPLVKLVI